MKLACSLLLIAIMVVAINGSAIPQSMEDDSDASESEQQLRELNDLLMGKRITCSNSV